MTERLKNILDEIKSGKRTNVYGLKLTKEDLLSKDSNGIYFLEYLINNKISLYSLSDVIENDAEIIYILCKNGADLYVVKPDENTLFSKVNDKRVIDYILEADKLNRNIVSAVKENMEIIDLLIFANKYFYLGHISQEIINKLTLKDEKGSYYIERYLISEYAVKELVPLINNPNILLEICDKHNNYDLLKYANKNVLMANYNQNNAILDFLINEKNITPSVLNNIPNDINFIDFLERKNLYEYLQNASEEVLLLKTKPNKTLLETLIEKNYNPHLNYIYKEKTIVILYRLKRLDLIQKVENEIMLKPVAELFDNQELGNKTFLEYMIDNNYNLNLSYNRDKNIIRILYQRQRPDLLIEADTTALLEKIEESSDYTYFDYILECIKEGKARKNINKKQYTIGDINSLVKYYFIIAKHDMMNYANELTKKDLLKKINGITLLDGLLTADDNLTINKIIPKKVKRDPEIAVILKAHGLEQEDVDIGKDDDDYTTDYITSTNKKLGIGPLFQEGELCLRELEQLFLSDGKSDKDLIFGLISGYRSALFVNYNATIEEVKKLVEIKKQNMNRFCYIKEKESGFFKPTTGAIHCENATVDVLLHETGHALHYYLAENKVPDNYTEIVERARNNPEMLVKVELLANKYKEIMDKVKISVEKKYQEQFENYYTEEKRMEIYNILMKSKDEKKEEYKKLGIPEEQLDTILEGTYTVGEYINHQKRIFIKENVTAIMDNEFNSIAAICDILDAIYEGKLHNSELKSMNGDKIKRTAGHGINYYFDTKHGFDEMIANFATLSKRNNSGEMLNLLKSIVGDEVYNMISSFYYQNIIQVNNEELNVNKGYGGK